MSDIVFATQSYRHPSKPVSSQRVANAYAQAEPPDAKSSVTVTGSPGIDGFTELGNGPIRGLAKINGVGYAISGDEFYEFDTDGNGVLRGSGFLGNGPVSLAHNDLEILIVDGTKGWTYLDSTNTLAEITDADFNDNSKTVTYLDGYFILENYGTNEFFLSDLLDGTSYSALDYATAESNADRLVAVMEDSGMLAAMGEESIEYWQHTGALSFPLQLIKPTVARGIMAPHAKVRENGVIHFLGNDHVFYSLARGALTRLSTHAVEAEWEGYVRSDDAFCFSWFHRGHKFIVITFPSAAKTWEYDLATKLWHERFSLDGAGNEVRWRANCAMHMYDKMLIGDYNSGKIGTISSSVYTEWDETVKMQLISPPLHGRGNMVAMPFFQLDMETGVGNADSPDPEVIFDYSDDGGRTWVTPQETRTLGPVGEYGTRLQWDRLGSFYERSLRVSITDPVKRTVIAARCPHLELLEA